MSELNDLFGERMERLLSEKPSDVAGTHANDSEIEVFFDGHCPLCSREIAMLRRLDRKRRIRFTDISAADFNAAELGKSFDNMMAEIHGRLPDGTWVVGVEVFRRLYAAIGLRSLVAVSRWPVISQMLNVGYRVFAPLRLKLRPPCTAEGSCRVPAKSSPVETGVTQP